MCSAKKRNKVAIVHASVPPEMQDGSATIDSERFLALEKAVGELTRQVAYIQEWHGVDKAWGDDFSTFESRLSALEVRMSTLQAPSKLERQSSSLALFAKYLTFLWWIKEVNVELEKKRWRSLEYDINKGRKRRQVCLHVALCFNQGLMSPPPDPIQEGLE